MVSVSDMTADAGHSHVPSSGVIVRLKFRTSVGSGKWVVMVLGSSSSVKSAQCQLFLLISQAIAEVAFMCDDRFPPSLPVSLDTERVIDVPFCTRNCAADILGFFLFAASSFFLTDHICSSRAVVSSFAR